MRAATRAATARALALSSHPGPTLAVTSLSTALALAAGAGARATLLVAGAVLTGQLSIGWCNDIVDAERDRASGRTDKPVASRDVPVRLVAAATGVALAACVPLSLATGLRPGALHFVVVAGGWAYDLGLKRTPWSILPYLLSFGSLPAFVVLAAGGEVAAHLPAAGAALGAGAHCFNALPDIAADRATGVRCLPAVIGALATRLLGSAFLIVAASVLVLGPGGGPTPGAWAGLAVAIVLALAAAAAGARTGSRLPFALAIAAAAVDLALLIGASA